ncbi:hypothetical protein B0H63DRAFT_462639 [Podospora didyma]|uniref:Uncharacterized protein n=1 Tax=Podospora didyma TaxID=330526 RepID=A0AAE0P856_9PEZI|nr:hypothetical protein B0H63DRAFT_462639 [Podospora didyma]
MFRRTRHDALFPHQPLRCENGKKIKFQLTPHLAWQRASSTVTRNHASALGSSGDESKRAAPQERKEAAAAPLAAKPKRKTQTELDEELRLKMEGLSGDGGASGIEYEDGKAVAMKRGVRENMFRYI